MTRRATTPGCLAEQARHRRSSWLELIQTSGPLVTLPAADRALPNGPATVSERTRTQLRSLGVDTLSERGGRREQLTETVFSAALDWSDHYRGPTGLPEALGEVVPETEPSCVPTSPLYAADDERDEGPRRLRRRPRPGRRSRRDRGSRQRPRPQTRQSLAAPRHERPLGRPPSRITHHLGVGRQPHRPPGPPTTSPGRPPCPSAGRNHDRPWGHLMSVPGENQRPSTGSFAWPRSALPQAVA
jgi:hypothetical protein